ncbi:hypothetical protein M422DRAFT_27861 [Sphaerobolus stellatus SS14]|nr:hypothetical protein M422DRAFT_27861 [Sphaerobolus stellatus SS14]
MSATTLDPYTEKAQNTEITPQKKIDGLKEIIHKVETAMLTTRSADGFMHARAMTPAKPNDGESIGLHLAFIGNNASGKFNELKNDDHCNVSFYDEKTTNWVSIAGTARITQDRLVIKKYWSPMVGAYFGDLHDGVHKGNEEDPRVSVIEIIPKEISYWVSNAGAITRKAEEAIGVATGRVQTPGELRTITSEEIQLVEGLHRQ